MQGRCMQRFMKNTQLKYLGKWKVIIRMVNCRRCWLFRGWLLGMECVLKGVFCFPFYYKHFSVLEGYISTATIFLRLTKVNQIKGEGWKNRVIRCSVSDEVNEIFKTGEHFWKASISSAWWACSCLFNFDMRSLSQMETQVHLTSRPAPCQLDFVKHCFSDCAVRSSFCRDK